MWKFSLNRSLAVCIFILLTTFQLTSFTDNTSNDSLTEPTQPSGDPVRLPSDSTHSSGDEKPAGGQVTKDGAVEKETKQETKQEHPETNIIENGVGHSTLVPDQRIQSTTEEKTPLHSSSATMATSTDSLHELEITPTEQSVPPPQTEGIPPPGPAVNSAPPSDPLGGSSEEQMATRETTAQDVENGLDKRVPTVDIPEGAAVPAPQEAIEIKQVENASSTVDNVVQETTDAKPVQPLPTGDDMMPFEQWKQKMLEEQEEKHSHSTTPTPLTNGDKSKHKKPKKRVNYSSANCGAKITAHNSEATNAGYLLKENRDQYIIQPCKAKKWVVVELCEPIRVETVELGNLEFFSSVPEYFNIYLSDRPNKEWRKVSTFQARNERTIQLFQIPENLQVFAKYIKLEMVSHYGNEHYCPLTVLRVSGKSLHEDIDQDDSPDDDDDDEEDILEQAAIMLVDNKESRGSLFDSAKDTVIKLVRTVFNGNKKPGEEVTDTGKLLNTSSANSSVTGGQEVTSSGPCQPGVTIPVGSSMKPPTVTGPTHPQAPKPDVQAPTVPPSAPATSSLDQTPLVILCKAFCCFWNIHRHQHWGNESFWPTGVCDWNRNHPCVYYCCLIPSCCSFEKTASELETDPDIPGETDSHIPGETAKTDSPPTAEQGVPQTQEETKTGNKGGSETKTQNETKTSAEQTEERHGDGTVEDSMRAASDSKKTASGSPGGTVVDIVEPQDTQGSSAQSHSAQSHSAQSDTAHTDSTPRKPGETTLSHADESKAGVKDETHKRASESEPSTQGSQTAGVGSPGRQEDTRTKDEEIKTDELKTAEDGWLNNSQGEAVEVMATSTPEEPTLVGLFSGVVATEELGSDGPDDGVADEELLQILGDLNQVTDQTAGFTMTGPEDNPVQTGGEPLTREDGQIVQGHDDNTKPVFDGSTSQPLDATDHPSDLPSKSTGSSSLQPDTTRPTSTPQPTDSAHTLGSTPSSAGSTSSQTAGSTSSQTTGSTPSSAGSTSSQTAGSTPLSAGSNSSQTAGSTPSTTNLTSSTGSSAHQTQAPADASAIPGSPTSAQTFSGENQSTDPKMGPKLAQINPDSIDMAAKVVPSSPPEHEQTTDTTKKAKDTSTDSNKTGISKAQRLAQNGTVNETVARGTNTLEIIQAEVSGEPEGAAGEDTADGDDDEGGGGDVIQKVSTGKHQMTLMKLKNKIRDLELNLNLSSRYLEELSQRYKKRMEELYVSLNKTIQKLSDTAKIAEERDVKQQERIGSLERQLHQLTATLEKTSSEVVERHLYLMVIELTIFMVFLYWCSRLQKNHYQERLRTVSTSYFNATVPAVTHEVKGHRRVRSADSNCGFDIAKRSSSANLGGDLNRVKSGSESDLLIVEKKYPEFFFESSSKDLNRKKKRRKQNKHAKNESSSRDTTSTSNTSSSQPSSRDVSTTVSAVPTIWKNSQYQDTLFVTSHCAHGVSTSLTSHHHKDTVKTHIDKALKSKTYNTALRGPMADAPQLNSNSRASSQRDRSSAVLVADSSGRRTNAIVRNERSLHNTQTNHSALSPFKTFNPYTVLQNSPSQNKQSSTVKESSTTKESICTVKRHSFDSGFFPNTRGALTSQISCGTSTDTESLSSVSSASSIEPVNSRVGSVNRVNAKHKSRNCGPGNASTQGIKALESLGANESGTNVDAPYSIHKTAKTKVELFR